MLAAEVLGLNRVFPRNRWNRAYRYLDRNLSEGGEVDQPAGAFLLFRRDLWVELGGFDEHFHRCGLKTWIFAGARAIWATGPC